MSTGNSPFGGVRDTLFGDMPVDRWQARPASSDFPWNAFDDARASLAKGDRATALAAWQRVADAKDLEARQYLQAWHFLRQHGQQPPADHAKHVYGVIVEVTLPEGPDVLAGYADQSARYYNHSGKGVVWEQPDPEISAKIAALLAAGQAVVAQIGPWDEARPPAPEPGHARLSFLTPGGLHFGEGSIDMLSADPLAGPVLQRAFELMQALIAKDTR